MGDARKKRTLRSFLLDDPVTEAKMLSDKLKVTENLVKKELYPFLVPDKDSHAGCPHLESVENYIDDFLNIQPNLNFSYAEAYVLIVSILLHDMGKVEEFFLQDMKGSGTKNKLLDVINELTDDKYLNTKYKMVKTFRLTDHKREKNLFEKIHPILSALKLLQSPEKWSIFDEALADAIARVISLHNYKVRTYAEDDGWLEDLYLDKYGKIRISWLAALLCLADELDTSYHRSTNLKEGDDLQSKGKLRSLISGCELDLVGRLLILHPGYNFLRVFRDKSQPNVYKENKNLLKHICEDIDEKDKMISAWVKEFKQMGLELRACMLLIDNHLVTTRVPRNVDQTNFKLEDLFQLGIEPNLTPMKVDRVLEGIFKLRLGVFGQFSFSWDILSSEAGMQSAEEVKRIFRRIAKISSRDFGEIGVVFIPFKYSEAENKIENISFLELNEEWSINLNNETNPSDLILLHKRICQRFAHCFKEMKRRHRGISEEIEAGDNNDTSSAQKTDIPEECTLYLCTGNKELNYLLDELMCEKEGWGRGILIPKYYFKGSGDTDNNDIPNYRPMGVNVVISGPPGVGKSSLALEIISSLRRIFCTGDNEKNKCQNNQEPKLDGVAAYISIEQPVSTVYSLADRIVKDLKDEGFPVGSTSCPQKGSKQDIELKPLQTNLIPGINTSHDSHMGRSFRNIYQMLTKGAEEKRIILFPKLSPRFYPEQSTENINYIFWQRFKQLCKLCENGPWYNQFWNSDENARYAPLLAIVIDNINAFGQRGLVREQIYQLFRLTSWAGVLGIYIYEHNEKQWDVENRFFDEVAFLSDICINMSWSKTEYKYKQLEILKSRYQRHVLGSHPFKIRNSRVKIYLSLHTQSFKAHAIAQKEKKGESNVDQKMIDLGIVKGKEIKSDAVVLLEGERGQSKLPISILYATGENLDGFNSVIFNFGPKVDLDQIQPSHTIDKIKICKSDNKYHNIEKEYLPTISKPSGGFQTEKPKQDKYTITTYGIKLNNKLHNESLYWVDFDTGYLMVEECFSMIEEIIGKYKPLRVVFYSVYHLPSRFPMLWQDQKFFPYLIQILKLKNISLLIAALGEDKMHTPEQKEMYTGLRSSADIVIKASRPVHDKKVFKLEIEDIAYERYEKIDVEVRLAQKK